MLRGSLVRFPACSTCVMLKYENFDKVNKIASGSLADHIIDTDYSDRGGPSILENKLFKPLLWFVSLRSSMDHFATSLFLASNYLQNASIVFKFN